jgi:hypothetical protein
MYRFIEKTENLLDENNAAYCEFFSLLLLMSLLKLQIDLQFSGTRWLGLRLETIGNVLVFCTSFYCAIEKVIVPILLIQI